MTVWALDLLSGNIFWLSEINPDVWVRTAPAGVLRKQCISIPVIIYMQQQSLGSAGMGMKLRLFFVKAYKITEDWFFYMKKRFIFESSCSITLEGGVGVGGGRDRLSTMGTLQGTKLY